MGPGVGTLADPGVAVACERIISTGSPDSLTTASATLPISRRLLASRSAFSFDGPEIASAVGDGGPPPPPRILSNSVPCEWSGLMAVASTTSLSRRDVQSQPRELPGGDHKCQIYVSRLTAGL